MVLQNVGQLWQCHGHVMDNARWPQLLQPRTCWIPLMSCKELSNRRMACALQNANKMLQKLNHSSTVQPQGESEVPYKIRICNKDLQFDHIYMAKMKQTLCVCACAESECALPMKSSYVDISARRASLMCKCVRWGFRGGHRIVNSCDFPALPTHPCLELKHQKTPKFHQLLVCGPVCFHRACSATTRHIVRVHWVHFIRIKNMVQGCSGYKDSDNVGCLSLYVF